MDEEDRLAQKIGYVGKAISWIIMGLATLGIINILVFLYEASKYQ